MNWEQKGFVLLILLFISWVGNLLQAAYIGGLNRKIELMKMLNDAEKSFIDLGKK